MLLVLATLVYYLLVLLVSRRWSGGTLEDGRSADLMGLRSVALMTAVWLAGSLVAGPLLGLLGQAVRSERTAPARPERTAPAAPARSERTAPALLAALAAGGACGALAGEGWWFATVVPPWRLLAAGDDFFRGVAAGEALRLVLPVVVLLWLAARHRLWPAWPALLGAFVAAGGAGALCWYTIHRI